MSKIDTKNIASLLLRIRTAKHLSQNSFAQVACSQGMLSKIENATTSPTFNKINAILKQMDISLSEFEFLLLENEWTKERQYNYMIENYIDTYHFNHLVSFFQNNRKDYTLASYIVPFQNWCFYCFNYSFSKTLQQDYSYMLNLLNQDEFFNHDFRKIIYGLPSLELDTAFYNYNRIQSQLQLHQYGKTKPYLAIDAAITISCIFLKNNNLSEAYHHFYFALQQARKIMDVHRIILCSIFLYFLSDDKDFLSSITALKSYFSKDIFYEYWYNVLYIKFNEV